MKRRVVAGFGLCLVLLSPPLQTHAAPADYGLPCERFECAGAQAFILTPKPHGESVRRAWVFYAPTLPAYPDKTERWMHEQFLEAGVAVAGIDVGEAYGSPNGRRLFDAFYEEMTQQRGYAIRPCLLARSRGGLWHSSWASKNPGRVAALAAIYPAFDLRSYPGLERAAGAYGLSPADLEKELDALNPVNRLGDMAAARIPVYVVHGSRDQLVPYDANSSQLAAAYERAGASDLATIDVKEGQTHSRWRGYFTDESLIGFVIKHARLGAENVADQEAGDNVE